MTCSATQPLPKKARYDLIVESNPVLRTNGDRPLSWWSTPARKRRWLVLRLRAGVEMIVNLPGFLMSLIVYLAMKDTHFIRIVYSFASFPRN